jgi:excisionase family DNA binding protein
VEIVVAGKSSRVPDALPELNLEQLEPLVERVVKRVAAVPRPVMTVREFAQAHSLGLTTAYQELKSGRLKAIKVGTKTLITVDAQLAWLASLPQYQPAFELESA